MEKILLSNCRLFAQARRPGRLLAWLFFGGTLLFQIPLRAQLTIIPTFDSSITSDPNAAAIISTINQAIEYYRTTFSDPIAVTINFQEMTTGLGRSSWWYYNLPYATFRNALQADATSLDDFLALSHLPTGALNPVNGTTFIALKTADIRALGIAGSFPSGIAGGFDGIIGLNTALTNLTRTSINPSKYDLLAVTEHEIDEILGLSSGLDITSAVRVLPEDLFRYSFSGSRTFSRTGDDAYFSIDGGEHLLDRFNQTPPGDYADWWSIGPRVPQVQDAYSSPGSTPNLSVENVVLDVIGYNRAASVVPESSYLGYAFGVFAFVLIGLRRSHAFFTK